MIIALFGFLGSVVSDSALPAIQDAQDTVVAALIDVEGETSSANDSYKVDDSKDGDGSKENDEVDNSDGDNDEDKNGYVGQDGNDTDGDENGENGDVVAKTTKVKSYNLAAGFVMPTLIPQVAVDNSSNLVSCDHPEADCENTHSGNSYKSENNNGNSGNGNTGSYK